MDAEKGKDELAAAIDKLCEDSRAALRRFEKTRYNLVRRTEGQTRACLNCGKEVRSVGKGRPALYCSNECRMVPRRMFNAAYRRKYRAARRGK